MDPKKKYEILMEGQTEGISDTCRRYGISRTLYYRWLSRYKASGMKGLQQGRQHLTPANITPKETEEEILTRIRNHPEYGPREISYLLEKHGIKVSESCVYNIMRRNGLSTREKRIRSARKKADKPLFTLPPLHEMKSGECMHFFLTSCATHKSSGMVYAYTLMDYRSKIACTRLYSQLSASSFMDLLTAAAIPVAHSLNFRPRYLCFHNGLEMTAKSRQDFSLDIQKILQSSGFDMTLFFLDIVHPLQEDFSAQKQEYQRSCLSSIMPLFLSEEPLDRIKLHLQREVRTYNIHQKSDYDGLLLSPTEYHAHVTGESLILPLWAYIDRIY